MTHKGFNFTAIWFILLSSSVTYCQIYMLKSPQFAQANQPVAIYAALDKEPDRVQLHWDSDVSGGEVEMTSTQSGFWFAIIPEQSVQGSEMSYYVTADDHQSPLETSPICSLSICPQYTVLSPEPMILEMSVVAEKKWNSDDNAFGLYKPQEGPPIGPASIAYDKGRIYVLDRVKKRVVSYNKAGNPQPALGIPSDLASDLVVDPNDDSIWVVSQLEDKVYRFQKDKLRETRSVPMKDELRYPAKFEFDQQTKTLRAEKQNRRQSNTAFLRQNRNSKIKLADQTESTSGISTEVQDTRLLFKINRLSQIFAVKFNRPVGYIEESVMDKNGIIWILYTMKGDYRIRRLARIDTANKKAEVTSLDVWFAYDATRHMTVTDNGVALMAGDEERGRILVFDYVGGVQ